MTGYVQLFMFSCEGAGYIDIKYTTETGSDDLLSVNMIQYDVVFSAQHAIIRQVNTCARNLKRDALYRK